MRLKTSFFNDALKLRNSTISVAIVFFLTSATFAHADARSYFTEYPKICVWHLADDQQKADTIRRSLEGALPKIKSHWIFAEALPESWGIVVDPNWTKSTAWWSPTQHSPDGTPAVLFSEQGVDGKNHAALLTHELTHMVHYSSRPKEEPWVKEGLALLAEYLVLGRLNPVFDSAIKEPEASLIAEIVHVDPKDAQKRQPVSQYGLLLQYFIYLYRVCGSQVLYERLLKSSSSKTGTQFINETLSDNAGKAMPTICRSFDESFKAFQMARFRQDPSSEAGFVIFPMPSATVRKTLNDLPALPPYSAGAYKIPFGSSCARGDSAISPDICLRTRLAK